MCINSLNLTNDFAAKAQILQTHLYLYIERKSQAYVFIFIIFINYFISVCRVANLYLYSVSANWVNKFTFFSNTLRHYQKALIIY